jgi:hypothetical protein
LTAIGTELNTRRHSCPGLAACVILLSAAGDTRKDRNRGHHRQRHQMFVFCFHCHSPFKSIGAYICKSEQTSAVML